MWTDLVIYVIFAQESNISIRRTRKVRWKRTYSAIIQKRSKWMFFTIPSREMADKQAFSIVSNANHFGHNSGFSTPLSLWQVAFRSLQLTRISWTLEKTATELESNLDVVFFSMTSFWRNDRSLKPSFGALSLIAVHTIGLNNLIRNWTLRGDSRRLSSWPWDKSIANKKKRQIVNMCIFLN